MGKRPWWRVAAWLALGLGSVLLVATAGVYATLPDLDELTHYQPKQPLRIFSADGELLQEFGSERRRVVPLADIPPLMRDALLAVEDDGFYSHQGISVLGIGRALLANLGESRSQGASTITQQLARDLYLSKKKTYTRKFVEVLLALKIESRLSKDEILQIYMNQIYLGQRAYGFEAAANTYFGKSLKQLSLAEASMLAGLPKNPYYANPIQNFERAKRRQAVVLGRMVDTGRIQQAAADQALAEPLQLRRVQERPIHAEYAAEMVRQSLYEQYGEAAYTRGFSVKTTLQSDAQIAAYKALRRALVDFDRRQAWRGPLGYVPISSDDESIEQALSAASQDHQDLDDLRVAVVTEASPRQLQLALLSGEVIRIEGEGLRQALPGLSANAAPQLKLRRGAVVRVQALPAARGSSSTAQWRVAQAPEVEGAVVALEPASGKLVALVGGFDFARNQFNHATQAMRQPGSSFKPLLYSAALEDGAYPGTVVEDAPLVYGDWEPKNSDGLFDGPITLRQALARSRNMVSIRLIETIGPERARQWAGKLGLDTRQQPANLTLALGSGTATPLQMASAYAAFANGGYLLKPWLIERITDASGQVLFEAPAAQLSESNRAISERNAFVTSTMLQEVMRSGTAARASGQLRRDDLYGKTGTTNQAMDAWFVGFQKQVVAAVWLGYAQPRSLGDRESGGGLALPVWIDFMNVALRNTPLQPLQAPSQGLVMSEGPQGPEWLFAEFAQDGAWHYLGSNGAPQRASAASAAEAAEVPHNASSDVEP
ncbi:penicillin-binding protein 1A [Roseateles sp. BYS180W]|uniref:Penicillin-binding protein 1A n=1 Tax=Roseateles rivi TaxID=3299028 RepID=A0ABW7FXU9_9BURK